MSQLPKPISTYVDRFNEQYLELKIDTSDTEKLIELINQQRSALNNLFMSGLGACTLILRLGAVINLCKKLEEGTPEEDALLMKQIIENLRENLPSDSNWKSIWAITCEADSEWMSCITPPKGGQALMEKFITFRNKYVHGYISLREEDAQLIARGIDVIHEISNQTSALFNGTQFEADGDQFYFVQQKEKIALHPFVQKGTKDGLPYIFQGLYNNKATAELISTFYGDIEKQEGSTHYESVFEPMRRSLKGGAGQVFDHSNRIEYYNECFVGRDKESKAILEWTISKDEQNILPVYSTAGMGKGALIASIITDLQSKEHNMPVLHHFCGSGIQNSLHATLYHFILQGKRNQLWKTEDEELNRKLNRLPSKYADLINLFHRLIDECFEPTRKNTTGNLAIVLDGLDEAAVAYSQLNISDWFQTYDENGEAEDAWVSPVNIRWIFTYRQGFYNFPNYTQNASIGIVQPLMGLSEQAARDALAPFNPSVEFVDEVIKRGAVQ